VANRVGAEHGSGRSTAPASRTGSAEGRKKAASRPGSIAAVYARDRWESGEGFLETAGPVALLESTADPTGVEATNRRRISPAAIGGGTDSGDSKGTTGTAEDGHNGCRDPESGKTPTVSRYWDGFELDLRHGVVWLAKLSEPAAGRRGGGADANTV